MKQITSFILVWCWVATALSAQDVPTFTVKTSSDELLAGHLLRVEFVLENAGQAEFEPPIFAGFAVVSGPSQSSSVQVINGYMTQSMRYTYLLRADTPGTQQIGSARTIVDGVPLETEPISLTVLDNPDNIPQTDNPMVRDPFHFEFGLDGFPNMPDFPILDFPSWMDERPTLPQQPEPPRKQRKTYKL